jgi:hypothetical protein
MVFAGCDASDSENLTSPVGSEGGEYAIQGDAMTRARFRGWRSDKPLGSFAPWRDETMVLHICSSVSILSPGPSRVWLKGVMASGLAAPAISVFSAGRRNETLLNPQRFMEFPVDKIYMKLH